MRAMFLLDFAQGCLWIALAVSVSQVVRRTAALWIETTKRGGA